MGKLAILEHKYEKNSHSSTIEEAATKNDLEVEYVVKEGRKQDLIWSNTYDIFKIFYKNDFDYIYAFNTYHPANIAPIISKIFDIDLIYAPHCLGFHGNQSKWKNYLKRFFTFPFMKNSKIRCISEYERKKYQELGFDSEKLYRIPLSVDHSNFSSSEPDWESHEVFSLANARRFKNIEDQVRAASRLAEVYDDFKLNIIGGWPDSEYRSEIEDLTEVLDVSENVIIHGFLSKEKMFDVISKCQVFIHTSHFESQCLAIYEAASAGFPLCMSDVPVPNHNFGDFKHVEGDYKKLAEDVQSVLEMPIEEKRIYSEYNRIKASDFNESAEKSRLRELFSECARE